MGPDRNQILRALWLPARTVALGILAGVLRWRDPKLIEARILALSPRDQAAVVLAVLGGLFLVSLLFAQAGAVGMLGFLLLVIVLIG
ncbi:hypothetical protein [Cereibacter ovatus]|nr:hypothetical protein [Cereibacter ovatus]